MTISVHGTGWLDAKSAAMAVKNTTNPVERREVHGDAQSPNALVYWGGGDNICSVGLRRNERDLTDGVCAGGKTAVESQIFHESVIYCITWYMRTHCTLIHRECLWLSRLFSAIVCLLNHFKSGPIHWGGFVKRQARTHTQSHSAQLLSHLHQFTRQTKCTATKSNKNTNCKSHSDGWEVGEYPETPAAAASTHLALHNSVCAWRNVFHNFPTFHICKYTKRWMHTADELLWFE